MARKGLPVGLLAVLGLLAGCRTFSTSGVYDVRDYGARGDGIDVDCCRYVTISDCVIDTDDDSITLQESAAPGTGSYTWLDRIWEFMKGLGL